MFKSYSQQSLGLRSHHPQQSVLSTANPSLVSIAHDKYQSWKFFNSSAVTVNSQALSKLQASPKAVLSPVRVPGKTSFFQQSGISQMQRNNSQAQLSKAQSVLIQPVAESELRNVEKKRRQLKGSMVDKILEAAQETQERETKDFFLTHVNAESILPQIRLGDNRDYKSLFSHQKDVSYLVAKHVRLAQERLKFGKVETNHYQHYERQDPIDMIVAKVKPSEKTMNYKPKVHQNQKPSLELMKKVNKKLQEEKARSGDNNDTKQLVQETYEIFGMNAEDVEDVNAILAEEGDKIDYESKEIKFTEHQLEFRNICSKVNKEKSAEIFLKTNKDFSLWNMRDKNAVTYFLSRAAAKEPRNFIEKEIEEKKMKEEEYFYRKPVQITRVENQLEKEDNGEEEYDSEGYEYYSESGRSYQEQDRNQIQVETVYSENQDGSSNNLLNPNKKMRFASMSVGFQLKKRKTHSSMSSNKSKARILEAEEVKKLEDQKAKEEEELKKFIFLEKLKYEKAIKGYDRVSGLKANLDEFTDILMHKIFQKREPTNDFKYILKKDNTHARVDHSKPLYLDELKRFTKLQEVVGKRKMPLIQHDKKELQRDFRDINIFSPEAEEEPQLPSTLGVNPEPAKLKLAKSSSQKQVKQNFSGAWYLPVKKWGDIPKYQYDKEEPKEDQHQQIGQLTKQAIKYLVAPYKESSPKKVKLSNKGMDLEE